MRHITAILTAALLTAGCTMFNQPSETFLKSSDISLFWKGVTQVRYEPESCQLGYNSARNEYRVYSDDLSSSFQIRCSEMPVTEGQTIKAQVTWYSKQNSKAFNDLEFNIIHTDRDGHIWLWCQTHSMGIIIKNIQ